MVTFTGPPLPGLHIGRLHNVDLEEARHVVGAGPAYLQCGGWPPIWAEDQRHGLGQHVHPGAITAG